MARTALNPQVLAITGTNPVFTAPPPEGHMVVVGTWLHVKNASGGSINVTVETGGTVSGRAIADDVIAVPAGAERLIPLMDRKVLARPAAPDMGLVYVNFSAVASVTCALFRLP